MKSVGACSVFWVVLLVGIEIVTAGPVELEEVTFTVNDLIGMSSELNAVQEWCNRSSELWSFCNKYSRAKTTEGQEIECWENAKSIFSGDLTEYATELKNKKLSDAKVSIPENDFAPLHRSFVCNTTDKGFVLTLTNDAAKDVVLFKYPKPGPTTTTTASSVTENTNSETTPSSAVVPATDSDSAHQSDHADHDHDPATKAPDTSDVIATGDEDNHLNWIIPLAIVVFVMAGLVIAFFIHRRAKRAEYPPSATKQSNGDTGNGKAADSNSTANV